MTSLPIILGVSWLAGLAALAGAALAAAAGEARTRKQREVAHAVVALGGGILMAAVAFALVPKGMELLHPAVLALAFCGGGVIFCAVDYWLSTKTGSKAQLLAMLLDFVPEALSLGAVFASDQRLGVLLGLFIGAQNLPEGFNAYGEVTSGGVKRRHALGAFFLISFLGPVSAWLGFLLLTDNSSLTAAIMCFAGGGILYLVFQDLAPRSRMRRHWTPVLGAVLGFAAGMLGTQLLH